MGVAGHNASCLCEGCRPWLRRKDEQAAVERWRLSQLLDAGYSVSLAERIAASDADLHRAVDLLKRGCKPAVAALIVL